MAASFLRSLPLALLLTRPYISNSFFLRRFMHRPKKLPVAKMTSSSSSSPTSGKDYYSNIKSKWVDEYPSSDDIEEIWSFYKECGYEDPQSTLRSMLEPVQLHKKRILDYGCDRGQMTSFFCSSVEGVEGHGVDINEEAIKSAREKFPSLTFCVVDGLSIAYPNKYFDCVIAIATMKHVRYQDREAVYAELNRVADYALVVEQDGTEEKEESFRGWTFYNSNFAEEFESNFEKSVKVIRMAGDILGLYKCKEVGES